MVSTHYYFITGDDGEDFIGNDVADSSDKGDNEYGEKQSFQ